MTFSDILALCAFLLACICCVGIWLAIRTIRVIGVAFDDNFQTQREFNATILTVSQIDDDMRARLRRLDTDVADHLRAHAAVRFRPPIPDVQPGERGLYTVTEKSD